MTLTRRTWAAVVIVVAVTASAATVAANHVFPDSTGGFHDQIANIAGAGCATGFTDGTFKPQDPTTRGQFAAWMNRCGGRTTLTAGAGTDLTVSTQVSDVGNSVQIQAGATGSLATGGFVHLTGVVTARALDPADNNCPCFVNARLEDRTDAEIGPFASSVIHPNTGAPVTLSTTSIPLTGTFPIGPDETKEFGIEASFHDADVGLVNFAIQLNAVYVPFGPDGDNTIAFEP